MAEATMASGTAAVELEAASEEDAGVEAASEEEDGVEAASEEDEGEEASAALEEELLLSQAQVMFTKEIF